MEIQIYKTTDGLKAYPPHRHKGCEILLYLEGTGQMKTELGDYLFYPGAIIIMPMGIEHGSVSESGFKNISIEGSFDALSHFEKPVILSDNENGEASALAALIYENRFGNSEYLSLLCSAYICFLLLNISTGNDISTAVNKIISEITEKAYDSDINLRQMLTKSGYAEDYIRSRFKKITGKTPHEFLTDIRIKHACNLIEVYGSTLAMSEIARLCGYTDYIYFSKKFKSIIGISPQKYKQR